MSRRARPVSLTRYFMGTTEHFQNFPRRPHASFLYIFKPLADSLSRVGLRGDVEEALIGFSILYDRFRFAIDGENERSLGFRDTFHEVCRDAAEPGHVLHSLLDF